MIKRIVSADDPKKFRRLMGRHLGDPAIEAELDGPVADKPGKTWYLWLHFVDTDNSYSRSGPVTYTVTVGFAAAVTHPDHVVFETDWVHPDHRGQGYYRYLFARRLMDFPGRTIRAWCSDASRKLFLANGFTAVEEGVSPAEHHWTLVHARSDSDSATVDC